MDSSTAADRLAVITADLAVLALYEERTTQDDADKAQALIQEAAVIDRDLEPHTKFSLRKLDGYLNAARNLAQKVIENRAGAVNDSDRTEREIA